MSKMTLTDYGVAIIVCEKQGQRVARKFRLPDEQGYIEEMHKDGTSCPWISPDGGGIVGTRKELIAALKEAYGVTNEVFDVTEFLKNWNKK